MGFISLGSEDGQTQNNKVITEKPAKKTKEEIATIEKEKKRQKTIKILRENYGIPDAYEFLEQYGRFPIRGSGLGGIKVSYCEELNVTAIVDWSNDWKLIKILDGKPDLDVDKLLAIVDGTDRVDTILKVVKWTEKQALDQGQLEASASTWGGLTRSGYRKYRYTSTIKLKNAFNAKYKRNFSVDIKTTDTSYIYSNLKFYN